MELFQAHLRVVPHRRIRHLVLLLPRCSELWAHGSMFCADSVWSRKKTCSPSPARCKAVMGVWPGLSPTAPHSVPPLGARLGAESLTPRHLAPCLVLASWDVLGKPLPLVQRSHREGRKTGLLAAPQPY